VLGWLLLENLWVGQLKNFFYCTIIGLIQTTKYPIENRPLSIFLFDTRLGRLINMHIKTKTVIVKGSNKNRKNSLRIFLFPKDTFNVPINEAGNNVIAIR
jgi:hypothetical protein